MQVWFGFALFTQAPRSRVRGSKVQQQNANIPRPGSAGPSPLYWVHRALNDIGTGRDSLGPVDCTLVGPLRHTAYAGAPTYTCYGPFLYLPDAQARPLKLWHFGLP
ncbi:hypothetical protein PBRA_001013, partial [Plasmodiophora brassicae]